MNKNGTFRKSLYTPEAGTNPKTALEKFSCYFQAKLKHQSTAKHSGTILNRQPSIFELWGPQQYATGTSSGLVVRRCCRLNEHEDRQTPCGAGPTIGDCFVLLLLQLLCYTIRIISNADRNLETQKFGGCIMNGHAFAFANLLTGLCDLIFTLAQICLDTVHTFKR